MTGSDDPTELLKKVVSISEQLLEMLDAINARLDEIVATARPTKTLLTTKEASQLLGVSRTTIQSYKKHWHEGIHYFPKARGNLYNAELIFDWQQNQLDSRAHLAAIERWVAKQPANQKVTQKKGRRSK